MRSDLSRLEICSSQTQSSFFRLPIELRHEIYRLLAPACLVKGPEVLEEDIGVSLKQKYRSLYSRKQGTPAPLVTCRMMRLEAEDLFRLHLRLQFATQVLHGRLVASMYAWIAGVYDPSRVRFLTICWGAHCTFDTAIELLESIVSVALDLREVEVCWPKHRRPCSFVFKSESRRAQRLYQALIAVKGLRLVRFTGRIPPEWSKVPREILDRQTTRVAFESCS